MMSVMKLLGADDAWITGNHVKFVLIIISLALSNLAGMKIISFLNTYYDKIFVKIFVSSQERAFDTTF